MHIQKKLVFYMISFSKQYDSSLNQTYIKVIWKFFLGKSLLTIRILLIMSKPNITMRILYSPIIWRVVEIPHCHLLKDHIQIPTNNSIGATSIQSGRPVTPVTYSTLYSTWHTDPSCITTTQELLKLCFDGSLPILK